MKAKPEWAARGDAELLGECLGGNEDAWQALLERYAGLIYSIPLRRGLGRDLADEVFQSVVTTLLQRMAFIESADCLPKWLMVTTARRCNLLEQRQRRALVPPDLPEAPAEADPETILVREDLRAQVAQALTELSPRDREILVDLFDHELPYSQVAQRHGLAVGTLGSLRARALGRLRRILRARGVI